MVNIWKENSLLILKSHLDHGVWVILKTFMEKKQLNNMADTPYKLKEYDCMHIIFIKSNQIKSQHGEGKGDTKSHLYPKNLSATDTYKQRLNSFSPKSLGILFTLQGRPHAHE